MDPAFKEFILAQDSDGLTDYLDNTPIDVNLLNMWFRQAARLPGNWRIDKDENGESKVIYDRNAWLQTFYEKYIPDDVRQYKLTNRRRFQRCLPEEQTQPEPQVVVVHQPDAREKPRGRLLKTYPRADRERIIKDFNIQPEDVDYVRFVSTQTSETIIYTMCERPQQ